MPEPRPRVAILISGRGSNMAALLAAAGPAYPAEFVLVIANRPGAGGLALAEAAGLRALAIDHKAYPSREAFEARLDEALAVERIDLVCLAGFMRVLTTGFAERWSGRMLNVHPSLLPSFKGIDTHARALAEGVRLHGCTVHFVVPELDGGPIVAQAAVPVLAADDEATLAARVLVQEHRLYPAALALVAAGRARLEGGRTVLAADVAQAEGALVAPAIA